MLKVFLVASLSVFMVFGVILTGCSDQASEKLSESSQDQATSVSHDQEGSEHTDDQKAGEEHAGHGKYAEQLSDLSPSDRALAQKQKVCPVSGQQLGAMGKPIKVTINDRELFLCCQGCEDRIKNDPEKYLAKLPK